MHLQSGTHGDWETRLTDDNTRAEAAPRVGSEVEDAVSEEMGHAPRVVRLAYELAQTGKFDDYAAIERELVAAGDKNDVASLDRPGLRGALNEVCATGRERDADAWRRHTSA
jgi:hypothetical protein